MVWLRSYKREDGLFKRAHYRIALSNACNPSSTGAAVKVVRLKVEYYSLLLRTCPEMYLYWIWRICLTRTKYGGN